MLIKNFFKFSLVGITISFLSTLAILKFGGGYKTTVFFSIVGDCLFLGWLIYNLIEFRIAIPERGIYLICNLSAMLLYGGIATGFAYLIHFKRCSALSLPSKLYTYLFFNFKSLHFYTYQTMGKTVSALYFLLICLTIIVAFAFLINPDKLRKNIGIWE